MIPVSERKAVLEARLAEIKARLEGIEEELDSHNDQDWEDLATERETDEVLEGIGLSGQAEIRKINAALARIDEGEYGHCVKCGAEISQERLDVLPWTPFCRTCAP
jgi:RNA polymerase-binding transcription factor DksA